MMLAIFVILFVLDVVTTTLVLKRGGYEHNPLVRWLIRKLGMTLGLWIRVPFQIAAAFAAIKVGGWFVIILATAYALVVANNARHALNAYR